MKTILKTVCGLMLAVFIFSSCSKSDNPADNNLFVGKYNGHVSYNGATTVTNNAGWVEVVKVGDTYDFHFSDNIPTISNVQMSKGQQGYIGTVNGYTGTLSIDAGHLQIALAKNGAQWGADCNR